MLPKLREYHRPTEVDDALTLLRRPSIHTVPLAGGTTLLASPDQEVLAVVDLQSLPLQQIREESGRIRLGATARRQTLVEHPLVGGLANGLVTQGARESAPLPTRNAATVGGCVACGSGVDALLVALLALDAQVTLLTPDRLRLSLDRFLGERTARLAEGALITEVSIPRSSATAGTALLSVSRTPSDQPILIGVACITSGEDGVCHAAALVLGGLGARPRRLPQVESALVGTTLGEEILEEAIARASLPADAPTDARASGAYRLEVAPVLLRRVVQTAWRRIPRHRSAGTRFQD